MKDIEQENGYEVERNISINVMDKRWITRKNRDVLFLEDKWSFFRHLQVSYFADFVCALGKYKYGSLIGPQSSIYSASARRSKVMTSFLSSSYFNGDNEKLKRAKQIIKKFGDNLNMLAIRILAWILGKLWSMVFTSIEVDGLPQIKKVVAQAGESRKAIVFLPTHRSHIDYLLLSYICFGANLPLPTIVAGNNLDMFLIGKFLASSGALFIRRRNNEDLYNVALEKYVHEVILSGRVLEVFIEGGRTRTGFISKPRTGLLRHITTVFEETSACDTIDDVLFVPIAVDYDNVLENIDAKGQGGYAANLLGAAKKPESFLGTLRLMFRLLVGGNASHGKAYVRFGNAISWKNHLQCSKEADTVASLSEKIVQAQRESSQVTSVAVISFILLNLTVNDLRDARDTNTKYRFSPKDLFNLVFSQQTNQFKVNLISTVFVPKYITLVKILFIYKETGVLKYDIVATLHELKQFEFDSAIAEKQVWEGLRVLETYFQKRIESRSTLQRTVEYIKTFFTSFKIEVKESSMENDAKFRLNLSYSLGQLMLIFLPFSFGSISLLHPTIKGEVRTCLMNLVTSYYYGGSVSNKQMFEAQKILLSHLGKHNREDFDNLCLMFVSHILPSFQLVNLFEETTLDLESARKSAVNALLKEYETDGYTYRAEILNRSLMKKILEFKQESNMKGCNEAIREISASFHVNERRLIHSKKLAHILRDIEHVTKRRFRKFIVGLAIIYAGRVLFRRKG